jgi:hypothetical protein
MMLWEEEWSNGVGATGRKLLSSTGTSGEVAFQLSPEGDEKAEYVKKSTG